MAQDKALNIANKISDFHQELTDLLKKYDAHPEDGKIQLTTSDLTLRADDISKCPPECIMRTPVTHANGTTTIDIWCSC